MGYLGRSVADASLMALHNGTLQVTGGKVGSDGSGVGRAHSTRPAEQGRASTQAADDAAGPTAMGYVKPTHFSTCVCPGGGRRIASIAQLKTQGR